MWVCRWMDERMDKCVGNDQMKKRRHEILCSCVFASVNICHRCFCMCGNMFTVGEKMFRFHCSTRIEFDVKRVSLSCKLRGANVITLITHCLYRMQ